MGCMIGVVLQIAFMLHINTKGGNEVQYPGLNSTRLSGLDYKNKLDSLMDVGLHS